MTFEPGDHHGLELGIRFLVERPRWRAQLGHNARRLVTERYTWSRNVDAVLGRLAELERAVGAERQ